MRARGVGDVRQFEAFTASELRVMLEQVPIPASIAALALSDATMK